jgi:hypothetical protein
VRPAAPDARVGWSRLDDAVSIGKQLRFGGVCCLLLEGSYISRTIWRVGIALNFRVPCEYCLALLRKFSGKCSTLGIKHSRRVEPLHFLIKMYDRTSQKTVIFILTAVLTSNLKSYAS